MAEATFGDTHLLALSRIAANPLAFSVAAYFLGQMCHALGADIKSQTFSKFKTMAKPMGQQLHDHATRKICEAYGLSEQELGNEDKALNIYLLADSYVVASGGSIEREILQAREGFFKASTVAFLLMSFVFLASLFVGGTKIQGKPAAYDTVSFWMSLAAMIITGGMALLFWWRYIFFNCLKRNNTLMIFLALHSKDTQGQVSDAA